jgi:quercetin dioxygenase-like cupin family protein
MSNASPKLDGVDTTFRHMDDIDWTPVQRQRNADGSESVVREKWPIFRPDFLSAYVHYEPGMVVRRHGHRSNHIVFVLDGGARIGGEWCAAGTHIHVPLGATFGPIIAGPAGVTCWELSFGEFGGWGDQPELYEQAIAELGVTPLPDPPLELADWFVDPRGDVGAERATPKIEGLQETVTVMDDLPWTEVRRQRNADGTVAAVREKLPIAEPDFRSAYVEYDPGMIVPRHGRWGDHLVWVIAGGAWFGERWCPAGTHIELPSGAAFGPIIAGEEGARFLELTNGDVRSWDDQPELYDEAIAAHGVTPLPDPRSEGLPAGA